MKTIHSKLTYLLLAGASLCVMVPNMAEAVHEGQASLISTGAVPNEPLHTLESISPGSIVGGSDEDSSQGDSALGVFDEASSHSGSASSDSDDFVLDDIEGPNPSMVHDEDNFFDALDNEEDIENYDRIAPVPMAIESIKRELKRVYPDQSEQQHEMLSQIEDRLLKSTMLDELDKDYQAQINKYVNENNAYLDRVLSRLKKQAPQLQLDEDDDLPIHMPIKPALKAEIKDEEVEPAYMPRNSKLTAKSEGSRLMKRKHFNVPERSAKNAPRLPQVENVDEWEDDLPSMLASSAKQKPATAKKISMSQDSIYVIHDGHKALDKSIDGLSEALVDLREAIGKFGIKVSVKNTAENLINDILKGKQHEGSEMDHGRFGGIKSLRTLQAEPQTHQLDVLDSKDYSISEIRGELETLYDILSHVTLQGQEKKQFHEALSQLQEAGARLTRTFELHSGTLAAAYEETPDAQLHYNQDHDETVNAE